MLEGWPARDRHAMGKGCAYLGLVFGGIGAVGIVSNKDAEEEASSQLMQLQKDSLGAKGQTVIAYDTASMPVPGEVNGQFKSVTYTKEYMQTQRNELARAEQEAISDYYAGVAFASIGTAFALYGLFHLAREQILGRIKHTVLMKNVTKPVVE